MLTKPKDKNWIVGMVTEVTPLWVSLKNNNGHEFTFFFLKKPHENLIKQLKRLRDAKWIVSINGRKLEEGYEYLFCSEHGWRGVRRRTRALMSLDKIKRENTPANPANARHHKSHGTFRRSKIASPVLLSRTNSGPVSEYLKNEIGEPQKIIVGGRKKSRARIKEEKKEACREKLRIKAKAYWSNPDNREKHSQKLRSSKIEIIEI